MFGSLILNKVRSLGNKVAFSATVYDSRIDKTAAVRPHARVHRSTVGRYSYVARNTLVQNASIGNFCSVSEGCLLGLPSHPTDGVSTSPVFLDGKNYLNKNFARRRYEDCPKTVIGNDVWIGAGAVVTRDVPPYAIVAGVPAKVLRFRFDPDTVEKLEASRWWDRQDDDLAAIAPAFEDVASFIEENGL